MRGGSDAIARVCAWLWFRAQRADFESAALCIKRFRGIEKHVRAPRAPLPRVCDAASRRTVRAAAAAGDAQVTVAESDLAAIAGAERALLDVRAAHARVHQQERALRRCARRRGCNTARGCGRVLAACDAGV
jgi:hypothetical protein